MVYGRLVSRDWSNQYDSMSERHNIGEILAGFVVDHWHRDMW